MFRQEHRRPCVRSAHTTLFFCFQSLFFCFLTLLLSLEPFPFFLLPNGKKSVFALSIHRGLLWRRLGLLGCSRGVVMDKHVDVRL